MKVPLSWLREYVHTEATAEQIAPSGGEKQAVQGRRERA